MSSPPGVIPGLELISNIDPEESSSSTSSKSSPSQGVQRWGTVSPSTNIDIVALPAEAVGGTPPFTELDSSHTEIRSVDKSPPQVASSIRRSSSTLSSGSSGHGSRDRKRLRFTPLPNAQAGPSTISTVDVFFPGDSLSRVEEGRRGKNNARRDQEDYLKSDPGTPNLQETLGLLSPK
jgi:hypothetical protein